MKEAAEEPAITVDERDTCLESVRTDEAGDLVVAAAEEAVVVVVSATTVVARGTLLVSVRRHPERGGVAVEAVTGTVSDVDSQATIELTALLTKHRSPQQLISAATVYLSQLYLYLYHSAHVSAISKSELSCNCNSHLLLTVL